MEKDGSLVDNVESSWRGVLHMIYNEADDSIYGINSTAVYFGLWSTSNTAVNFFEEQANNRKLISQNRRISTPSEPKINNDNPKNNARAPSVDKRAKPANNHLERAASGNALSPKNNNHDQKKKILNLFDKPPVIDQRKIHSSGSGIANHQYR
jgi:hypothetical protein